MIKIISTLSKQREESISQFRQGNRPDLVAKEEAELAFLKGFLPEPISESVLSSFVDQVIQTTGASGPKDMGKVMKGVMELVKGKGHADGKVINRLVSEKLK